VVWAWWWLIEKSFRDVRFATAVMASYIFDSTRDFVGNIARD
jgi:hypothetical protein